MAVEFLRFGSSIPGAYWGCCNCCIIQNFKSDPDSPASIQLVDGDGGNPIIKNGEAIFAGKTEREIFLQRLRYGTFSSLDMPNHVFLAVLTKGQISGGVGKKWLEILKQEGFEFLFAADNSVYSGDNVGGAANNEHPNYYFALIRNIGYGAMDEKSQFVAPKAWTDLPDPYKGDMSWENRRKVQTELYNKLPKNVFYSQKQLEDAGVPVTMAGVRSNKPQESLSQRQQKEGKPQTKAKAVTPFA